MDIDRGLMSAIIRDGMARVYDEGVTVEMVEGASRSGFTFIETFFRTFGKTPSADVFIRETGIELAGLPVEPMAFWCGQVRKRFQYNTLKTGISESLDKLETRDTDGALGDLEKMVFEMRRQAPGGQRTQSIFADPDALFEDYERSKLGVTGVPTPWTSMNMLTLGWNPEDLVVIAARMGVGKSWLLCVIAKWAWEQGKKVLLASTEMSRMSLRKRVAALVTKTSYGRLRRGNLTTFEEDAFKQKLAELKDDERFLMMGDGFAVTLESVEAAIVEYKPDVVCIDGIYLMRSSRVNPRNKFERVAEVLDLTKDMAKRHRVPVIVTTQLNREQKKFGGKQAQTDITMDRLAFSDNMGMVSDYVFFIKQTQEMKAARELEIQPGKVRESEVLKNILINWNFETQDFTEKPESEGVAAKKAAKQMKDTAAAAGDDSHKDDDTTSGDPMKDPPRDIPW